MHTIQHRHCVIGLLSLILLCLYIVNVVSLLFFDDCIKWKQCWYFDLTCICDRFIWLLYGHSLMSPLSQWSCCWFNFFVSRRMSSPQGHVKSLVFHFVHTLRFFPLPGSLTDQTIRGYIISLFPRLLFVSMALILFSGKL